MNVEMGKQFAGHARVFRRDQPRLAQDAHGARTDVLQIANRGGDQIECAHAGILSSLTGRWVQLFII